MSRRHVDLSEYFENGLAGRTSLFYRFRCRCRYSEERFLSDELSVVCVTPAAISLSHWWRAHCQSDVLMNLISLTDEPIEISVTRPLTTAAMFARAVRSGRGKRSGQWPSQPVARTVVRQEGVTFCPRRIKAFRECCEFYGQAGGIPLPFPETCFTPLMAEVLTHRDFPLSPAGIIHLRQSATQHLPLGPSDILSALCELAAVRETDRGVELDFDMRLLCDGVLHWSGTGTVLSRRKGRSVNRAKASPASDTTVAYSSDAHVPGDTGRAFARASGDYNPFHLWKLTALPFGFSRPIAHGMWTFSRVLGSALSSVDAETSVTASAAFKRPLSMPGNVRIVADVLSTDRPGTVLAVHSRDGTPHLVGDASLFGEQAERSAAGSAEETIGGS